MAKKTVEEARAALAAARKVAAKGETAVARKKRELHEAIMAERAVQREKDIADMLAQHEEQDEFWVQTGKGSGDVLTLNSGWDGGVELGISEWGQTQSSVTISKENLPAIVEQLQKLL